MTIRPISILLLLLLAGAFSPGCRQGLLETDFSSEDAYYKQLTYGVDYSAADDGQMQYMDDYDSAEPWTLRRDLPENYFDLTLEQALQIALQNATILHDLGGTILTSPQSLAAIHDPAVAETDPRYGVDAALSQFDARFNTLFSAQKNDRPFNNFFVGGGSQLFQQDYQEYLVELSKMTATGTEFSARTRSDYDSNNRSQNLFPSVWDSQLEFEVRQPLLQGAGLDFNRIAGPFGRPGALQGIVIARLNTDIALTDFEIGLRDFISNVENAYWDLFFAYRLLDTTLEARDQSLKTWKSTISRIDQKGITAAKEAQAREQYFRFDEEMRNALAGRRQNATQTGNGSQPGTFSGGGGLYVAERRLRLLLGLPLKDETVIRPVSEPKIMPVDYDWPTLVDEAVTQRPELKKQRQVLKSLELQEEVSRQFKKPRLDMFGRYRFRGLGDNLAGDTSSTASDLTQGSTENLFGGDFQEWELGVEMSIPIGFRQGHAAVRNLEIQISRERARLHQQQRQIVHDLSNALSELRRVQEMSEISYNRLIAAQQRSSSLNEETDSPDEILDAQVRLAEAKGNYYRTLVEHEAAMRNLHFEKGSLLPFRNVILANSFSEEPTQYWEQTPASPADNEPIVPDDVLPVVPPVPDQIPPKIDPVAFKEPVSESVSEPVANPAPIRQLPAETFAPLPADLPDLEEPSPANLNPAKTNHVLRIPVEPSPSEPSPAWSQRYHEPLSLKDRAPVNSPFAPSPVMAAPSAKSHVTIRESSPPAEVSPAPAPVALSRPVMSQGSYMETSVSRVPQAARNKNHIRKVPETQTVNPLPELLPKPQPVTDADPWQSVDEPVFEPELE